MQESQGLAFDGTDFWYIDRKTARNDIFKVTPALPSPYLSTSVIFCHPSPPHFAGRELKKAVKPVFLPCRGRFATAGRSADSPPSPPFGWPLPTQNQNWARRRRRNSLSFSWSLFFFSFLSNSIWRTGGYISIFFLFSPTQYKTSSPV